VAVTLLEEGALSYSACSSEPSSLMPSRNEHRFYVKDHRSALLTRSVLDVGSMNVQASTQRNGSKYLALVIVLWWVWGPCPFRNSGVW